MVNFRHIFGYLPDRWQMILKQLVYTWKVKTGRFVTDEPEFSYIESIVRSGDSVIDIGANIGVYTLKFSKLVGATGHVYAFEPIQESFYHLTIHSNSCTYRNITLVNMAVSDKARIATMTIPRPENRSRNYYRASMTGSEAEFGRDSIKVFCCTLDSFDFPARIRLVKIDVEGHEAAVMSGMMSLIERDKPVLIVESISPEDCEWLESRGYQKTKLPSSPNTIFEYTSA